MAEAQDGLLKYRAQHKRRLSWMPYLYFTLAEKHREWAKAWQEEVQRELCELETVTVGEGCFVSPDAHVFAEPGRAIEIGDGSSVAAEVFMHGPVVLGRNVSLNPRCTLDGRAAGIRIGDGTRVAHGVSMFAFNHGMSQERLVMEQPVTSVGIRIGADVWVGANAGVTDGVTIGDHAVVGMGAVVTTDVAEFAIVAGVPARVIGDRRER